jgi:hypothetical protein
MLSDWIHNLPVVGMAILFFGCASLAVAGIYAVVVEFPTSLLVRARAFSPSMLSPLGTLFALFALFTAVQVWNDNDRASAAVAQEASALRNALVLATAFPGEPRSRLEALIHSYIEEAATKEWPMMARQTETLEIAPRTLIEALQLTLALTPSSQGQGIAQREMAVELKSALDARRQRILVSHSSVSLVKWTCLMIDAICVLIAIALAHGDKRVAALVAMGLFGTGVAACFLLIALYDRPFVGQYLIRPDPLLQVMPNASYVPSDLKQ